jgi:hypothetical protein
VRESRVAFTGFGGQVGMDLVAILIEIKLF